MDPTTAHEKKDFPVERTLGIVGHIRGVTRNRLWRYIKEEALLASDRNVETAISPGAAFYAVAVRAFYAVDLAAPVEHQGDTWAVWTGTGEPDSPAFEPDEPAPEPGVSQVDMLATGFSVHGFAALNHDIVILAEDEPAPAPAATASPGASDSCGPPGPTCTKIFDPSARFWCADCGRVFEPVATPAATKESRVVQGPVTTPVRSATTLHNLGLKLYRMAKELETEAGPSGSGPEWNLSPAIEALLKASDEIHAEAARLELKDLRKALDRETLDR
jgi:hypothetical protein